MWCLCYDFSCFQTLAALQIVRDFINFILEFGVSNWGSESDDQESKLMQNHSKSLFFLWSLRGPGKLIRDDLCSKTFTLSLLYFFFRNLKMRLRDASCKHFGKRFLKIQQALADARFLRSQNRIKKRVVSESGDCKMTRYLRRFWI